MSRQLTIAVIATCPFPYSRGTPVRIQRLSEALASFGHTVHVFTYPIGEGTPAHDVKVTRTANPLGYKKFEAGPTLQKPLLDALMIASLTRFIAHRHVDIIYAHNFEGALVALAARGKRSVPIVYDAHTTLTGELGTYNKLLNAKPVASIGGWLDDFVPLHADHVISVSDEISEFLQARGVARERISVILNGTEYEVFAQGNAERARETYHLERRPTIIYTGNLASFQGIDYLLAAMPRALAVHPDAQLIIAGSGDSTSYQPTATKLGIEKSVRFINNTRFAGVVDLLAFADVAVVPRPVCPGLPLKLLNYMAAGTAVVAFEGSAKILEHLVTGYIAANEDVVSLANGIITCLSDEQLRAQLGARAQEMIVQSYSWEHMARKVEAVFEHVLTPEPAPVPVLVK